MDILSTTTNTAARSSATTQTAAPANRMGADFETFLKMLTTQMQNQDPLNPMESSDFAVQLATFSGVEQQMQTNALLEGLASQMGLGGMAQLAGLVGMEARAAVPAWFDGSPVTLSPNPDALADSAVLVTRNADGDVVSRESVPVSAEPIEWAGTDSSGSPLPGGLYSFELESYAGERLLGTGAVEIYSTVVEARGGSSGTQILLRGGVLVDVADVTALRSH